MSAASRIEKSMENGSPWLVLSPHLDDAVLSCGALLEAWAAKREITVATVFTESTPGPHTRAARSFLRQCAVPDARLLYEARRSEDLDVLGKAGIGTVHLGMVDALFRRRQQPPVGRRLWAHLPPEVTFRYPTYRFDIARGRISRGDGPLIPHLQGILEELLGRSGAELLFCPVGVGGHVDHLITRAAGERFKEEVVFYSDFPYDQTAQPDAAFMRRNGLATWTWNKGIIGKQRMIQCYGTQVDALFPSGEIPAASETYFVPS